MKKYFNTQNKRYILLYLTLIYIVAFLLWWTYLLYHKTETHYDDLLKYQILEHSLHYKPVDKYINSVAYEKLLDRFQREKLMIITEGIVFCLILIFLVFKVKKSVEKEIKLSRQQQNFILSITHELKSPLSSIRLMAQTLQKHQLQPAQQEKLLKNTLTEANRLQNLVENVLLTAKLDNNESYGFAHNQINLSELVNKLVQQLSISHNVPIHSEIEENIQLNADTSGMSSIIINTIENAIKYSPEEKDIRVQLKKQENHILLSIADKGVGINEEEKNKVFDKFYRVGNEETRATKGTGLGLYVVKKLVKWHNGTIEIKNNKNKGSIFEVKFYTL